MTKRVGSFSENNNKKFKTDDLNHLWGDDLDSGDVEDCFFLATQVCEQEAISCTQRNNVSLLKPQSTDNERQNEESFLCPDNDVSILPSYDGLMFNQTSLVTSTQFNGEPNFKINAPAHSSVKFSLKEASQYKLIKAKVNNECLQSTVEKLQNDCLAKEGEASILRSQLKQIRRTMEVEQTKVVQAWTDKLSEARKETEGIRSDLEFKNLEIAKLRSQIIEVTKHFSTEASTSIVHSKEGDKVIEHEKNKSKSPQNQYMIEISLEYESLMSASILSEMLNLAKPEAYQTSLKYNGKCNQYVEKEDHIIVSELKKISKNKHFDLACVYPDISTLISCTTIEVDSDKCHKSIKKILCATQSVVQNFHDYLVILESNAQNEDIQQVDNLYLSSRSSHEAHLNLSLFNSKEWIQNEIGIKSRQMIALVSEILPFSSYIRHQLFDSDLQAKESNTSNVPSNKANQKFSLLHLILSALTIIGNIRKSDDCVGFLSAVSHFLTNIYLSSPLNNCFPLVLSITKELILVRPPKQAINYLSDCFKKASSNECFAQDLCRMQRLKVCNREGKLSFKKDSCCVLQVYITLYEDNFVNKYDGRDFDVNLNTLQFMTNLLQAESLWIYFQETHYCECISKITSICMELICEVLRIHRNESASNKNKYQAVLDYSLRTLNILNFKFADLITVKPEYKFIVESLLDDNEFSSSDVSCKYRNIYSIAYLFTIGVCCDSLVRMCVLLSVCN